ncbi:MAG: GNAT family N-acetyltransferase [Candidatus Thorarchaeota archaeon]|nr:GNAT family N-acetyltransferase [Candidatus Thorarchaeota archaeon]
MRITEKKTSTIIRELRPDEMEEFITLLELSFRDTVEDDRVNMSEYRALMKKVHNPIYKLLTRILAVNFEFYVAELDGVIGSGVGLNIEKDEVFINNLMTHPDYRRQGLARSLLELSARRARELGKSKVRLTVRADNASALPLYRSEGFVEAYHYGNFRLESPLEKEFEVPDNDVFVKEIGRVFYQNIDRMLDDCYPTTFFDATSRERFIRNYIPSRFLRVFASKVAGQHIHTYGFYIDGETEPRGYIQANQSRVEDRIQLTSPILLRDDNELLLKALPKIIRMESAIRGLTAARMTTWMDRTGTISMLERLGFEKAREGFSMTKKL